MKRFLPFSNLKNNPSSVQPSPVKCYIKEISEHAAKTNSSWITQTRHFADLRSYDHQINRVENNIFKSGIGMIAPIGLFIPFVLFPELETFLYIKLETYLNANITLLCGSSVFGIYNSVRLIDLERKATKVYKEMRNHLSKEPGNFEKKMAC